MCHFWAWLIKTSCRILLAIFSQPLGEHRQFHCYRAVVLSWGEILSPFPQEHLAMSGDILGCHPGRMSYWRLVGEARDTAKHPTMHRTVLHPLQGISLPQNVDSPTTVNSELEGGRATRWVLE